MSPGELFVPVGQGKNEDADVSVNDILLFFCKLEEPVGTDALWNVTQRGYRRASGLVALQGGRRFGVLSFGAEKFNSTRQARNSIRARNTLP